MSKSKNKIVHIEPLFFQYYQQLLASLNELLETQCDLSYFYVVNIEQIAQFFIDDFHLFSTLLKCHYTILRNIFRKHA